MLVGSQFHPADRIAPSREHLQRGLLSAVDGGEDAQPDRSGPARERVVHAQLAPNTGVKIDTSVCIY